MIYTSSVATLGIHSDGTPSNEDTPVSRSDMVGHYKRSKFDAEESVKKLIRDDQLPIVIVNPSTPIGPRDVKPTPTGRIIVQAAAGRMPAFVDTGLNIVHVDDVAAGHLLALGMVKSASAISWVAKIYRCRKFGRRSRDCRTEATSDQSSRAPYSRLLI